MSFVSPRLSHSLVKTIFNNRRTSIPLLLKLLFLSLLISCISTLSTLETNAMCKLQSSIIVNLTINTDCSASAFCNWSKKTCIYSACSQSGVGCGQNVTSIELNAVIINGTLPSQIGNLRALNYLELTLNPGLSGTLPTQIGYLTMLTTLAIYSTGISGTIPTQTGFLTALNYLLFSGTQITGTLPTQMGLLTSLISLDCSDTPVSGTIPTQFGNMTALNSIDLSDTWLSGTLPTQIGFLKMLTTLDIFNTSISGTIPTQTGFLTALIYLNFAETQITGTLPTQMGLLTSLISLYCSDTPVSGTIPTQFGGMIDLKTVSFSYSEICGCFPHQWNKSLTSCDTVDVPNDCNCTIPVICSPSNCIPSACGSAPVHVPGLVPIPLPGPIPKPVPGLEPIPVPIPVPGPIPIPVPIPMLIPVPILTPASGCQGNYGTLFTCKDGKWISSSDVTLNGTDLIDASFETVSVTISGSVLVTSSNFTVINNFILETNSTLKIEDVNITVHGDLYIHSDSTLQFLSIKNYSQFNINGSTYLDGGNLTVSAHSSQEEQRLVVFTFQSLNGSFSKINVSLTDKKYSCDSVESSTSSSFNEFTVFFKINNCSSNSFQIPYWIWIVTGVVLLILVVPIIGAIFYQCYERSKKKEVLSNLKKKISPKQGSVVELTTYDQ